MEVHILFMYMFEIFHYKSFETIQMIQIIFIYFRLPKDFKTQNENIFTKYCSQILVNFTNKEINQESLHGCLQISQLSVTVNI